MLPGTCVVVPTYWTRPKGGHEPGDAVYDHPTPVDGEDTLQALLDSLAGLEADFSVLILVAVTTEQVRAAAEQRVREIADSRLAVHTLVFGGREYALLQQWLAENNLGLSAQFVGLRRYPLIRNLQLAVPLCLGSDAVVALDDDEVVVDLSFMQKAVEPLGSYQDGKRVDGLSGHYLQPNGGILLEEDPSKASSQNLFDRKARLMNYATQAAEAVPGRLVETSFCFGGNMEFTKELATSVGFDPGITRGEDIDYLINARMEGLTFFLRKDLTILHCPPPGGSYKDTTTSKLEQDVIRFMYERQKLALSQEDNDLQPVTAEELGPYPGEFLTEDIEAEAAEALTGAGFEGNVRDFIEGVNSEIPGRLHRYLSFRKEWPKTMTALRSAPELADRLLNLMYESPGQ